MMLGMAEHEREDPVGLVPRTPSHGEILAALETCWADLAALGDVLDDDQWESETALPGWSVRDIYAHIIGAERMLSGEENPDIDVGSPAHVRNDIGTANEAWVRSHTGLSTEELLLRFREVTAARLETLRAMSAEAWEAASWTPAGDATLARWLHIRVYDCWVHEQDIRVAVGIPGGLDNAPADLSLLEVVNALGFIVGKRAEAEDGSRIEILLDRSVAAEDETAQETLVLRVAVDGRAGLVTDFDAPTTSTVRMPFELFMRLTAGRRNASNALNDGLIQLDGDTRSGERLARNLAFTV